MDIQTVVFKVEDIAKVLPYNQWSSSGGTSWRSTYTRTYNKAKNGWKSWAQKYTMPSQANTSIWILRGRTQLAPIKAKIRRFQHKKIEGKSNQEVQAYLLNELDALYNRIEDRVGLGKQVGMANASWVSEEIRQFAILCESNKLNKIIANNMFMVTRSSKRWN